MFLIKISWMLGQAEARRRGGRNCQHARVFFKSRGYPYAFGGFLINLADISWTGKA